MGLFGNKETRQANKAKADAGKAQIEPLLSKVERISNAGAIHLAALELKDSETVEYAATGEFEGKGSCLLLTNERIVICGQKGASTAKHVLQYSNVDRVDVGMGLGGSSVSFFHGSEESRFEKSAHGALDEVRNIVETHRATGNAPAAGGVGVEDLAKLAELHAAGVLTDEEFAAAKAKALGL